MERHFLEIGSRERVAHQHMPLAPCLEPLGVGKLICQHLAAGRCGPALLDQPPVGIAGAIEYAFKSEGKRALVAVVLPKIADT